MWIDIKVVRDSHSTCTAATGIVDAQTLNPQSSLLSQVSVCARERVKERQRETERERLERLERERMCVCVREREKEERTR